MTVVIKNINFALFIKIRDNSTSTGRYKSCAIKKSYMYIILKSIYFILFMKVVNR